MFHCRYYTHLASKQRRECNCCPVEVEEAEVVGAVFELDEKWDEP